MSLLLSIVVHTANIVTIHVFDCCESAGALRAGLQTRSNQRRNGDKCLKYLNWK